MATPDFSGYPHLQLRYERRLARVLSESSGCRGGGCEKDKLDREFSEALRKARERDKGRGRR